MKASEMRIDKLSWPCIKQNGDGADKKNMEGHTAPPS